MGIYKQYIITTEYKNKKSMSMMVYNIELEHKTDVNEKNCIAPYIFEQLETYNYNV